ncbi:MAG: hypothetical protein SOI23_00665 [Atopobiaceae bacterium]|jgi:hypothetical protein
MAGHIESQPADETTRRSLYLKCQENGWLMVGGYSWQDDPWLEEYPYEFSEVAGLDDLRQAFRQGNWSIRQGFLYDDLAFVNQVDGGDEWWTLKRVGREGAASDWLDFESWSFRTLAEERAHGGEDPFANAIRSMQMATPEQCRKLDYMLPDGSPTWDFSKTVAGSFDGAQRTCRSFSAEVGGYRLSVYERPSFQGFASEVFDLESKKIIQHSENIASALDAAVAAQRMSELCRENGVHDPRQLADLLPIEDRAQAAISASRARPATAPIRAKGASSI